MLAAAFFDHCHCKFCLPGAPLKLFLEAWKGSDQFVQNSKLVDALQMSKKHIKLKNMPKYCVPCWKWGLSVCNEGKSKALNAAPQLLLMEKERKCDQMPQWNNKQLQSVPLSNLQCSFHFFSIISLRSLRVLLAAMFVGSHKKHKEATCTVLMWWIPQSIHKFPLRASFIIWFGFTTSTPLGRRLLLLEFWLPHEPGFATNLTLVKERQQNHAKSRRTLKPKRWTCKSRWSHEAHSWSCALPTSSWWTFHVSTLNPWAARGRGVSDVS